MKDILLEVNSPLFDGVNPEDRKTMLGCIGYHIGTFKKGDIVAFEEESIKHIGIIISGAVDMVKEDLWGNKTMLVRMRKDELFGETFACGSDNLSVVTFLVSEDARILFMPFDRVMHSCTMACVFHNRLIGLAAQGIKRKFHLLKPPIYYRLFCINCPNKQLNFYERML